MKITVIGGAGVRTVIFINGLLKKYKKLNIDQVVLYDIDRNKQRVIETLCRHVVECCGSELEVYAADDPIKAIEGADYIVTTLRVGGDSARVIDESIALEMGVIGQETTGAGGFSMAVRTLPVLLNYCEMIKQYAPNAWIFNFTNPSGLITQALKDAGYDRVIGICDAPSSTESRMAKELGVPEDSLYTEYFGLNHLSWIRSVKWEGKEILKDLLNDDSFLRNVQEFSMFDKKLLRMIGLLPNEYLYYYYHRERALGNMQKTSAARGKIIERVNQKMMEEIVKLGEDGDTEEALQIFLYYMQLRENSYMTIETEMPKRELHEKGTLVVPDGMGYAGVMLSCIEGLQSDDGTYLVLSVENRGSIPGMREDDVVEVTCKVSKKGIEPVKFTEIQEDCYLLMRVIKRFERMTIDAVKEKSENLAVEALMHHPLIQSYSLAKKLFDKYDEVYGGLFK